MTIQWSNQQDPNDFSPSRPMREVGSVPIYVDASGVYALDPEEARDIQRGVSFAEIIQDRFDIIRMRWLRSNGEYLGG